MRIDASTTYSFLRPVAERGVPDAPGIDAPVPERVRDACPEARILYVLRDPVERAASSLLHRARTDPALTGEVSLIQAMRDDPMMALIGRYGDQVERRLEVFARGRVPLPDLADLGALLGRIGAFLDLDLSTLDPARAEVDRHAGGMTLTPLGRLMRTHGGGFREAARAILPPGLRVGLRDRLLSRPSGLRLTGHAEAAALFADDLDKLEALTGMRSATAYAPKGRDAAS